MKTKAFDSHGNLRTPLKLIGGKSRVRHVLYEHFPKDYKAFYEPFLGSGSIIIGAKPTEEEITTDINWHVINFYTVIQYLSAEIFFSLIESRLNEYKASENPKELFYSYKSRLLSENHGELGQVDQAIYFYLVSKTAMNGILRFNLKGECNSTFCGTTTGRGWLDLEWLKLIKERISNIKFLSSKYWSNFERLETPEEDLFIFADPPYYEVFTSYDKAKFSKVDHKLLKSVLEISKAKWMVTLNDHPEVRDLYKDFNIREHLVEWSCSQTASGRGKKQELIITNY